MSWSLNTVNHSVMFMSREALTRVAYAFGLERRWWGLEPTGRLRRRIIDHMTRYSRKVS